MAAKCRRLSTDDDWMFDDYFFDAQDSEDIASSQSELILQESISQIKCYDDNSEDSWESLTNSHIKYATKKKNFDTGLTFYSNTSPEAGDSDEIESERTKESDSTPSSDKKNKSGISSSEDQSSGKPDRQNKSEQNFRQTKKTSESSSKESIENNSESSQSNKRKRKENARKGTKKKRKRKERVSKTSSKSDNDQVIQICRRDNCQGDPNADSSLNQAPQKKQQSEVVTEDTDNVDLCEETCETKTQCKLTARDKLGRLHAPKPGKYALSSRRPRCPRMRRKNDCSTRRTERKTERTENSVVREYYYNHFKKAWVPAPTSEVHREEHLSPVVCQPDDEAGVCECKSPEKKSNDTVLKIKLASSIFLPKDSQSCPGSATRTSRSSLNNTPHGITSDQLDSTSSSGTSPVRDSSGGIDDIQKQCSKQSCERGTILPQLTSSQELCQCESQTVTLSDCTYAIEEKKNVTIQGTEQQGSSSLCSCSSLTTSSCECNEAVTQTVCEMGTSTNAGTVATQEKSTSATNMRDVGTCLSSKCVTKPTVSTKNVQAVNNSNMGTLTTSSLTCANRDSGSCTIPKLPLKTDATGNNNSVSTQCILSIFQINSSYGPRTKSQSAGCTIGPKLSAPLLLNVTCECKSTQTIIEKISNTRGDGQEANNCWTQGTGKYKTYLPANVYTNICNSSQSEQENACQQNPGKTVEVSVSQDEVLIKCECPEKSFEKIPSIERAEEIYECACDENPQLLLKIEEPGELQSKVDASLHSGETICNCSSNEIQKSNVSQGTENCIDNTTNDQRVNYCPVIGEQQGECNSQQFKKQSLEISTSDKTSCRSENKNITMTLKENIISLCEMYHMETESKFFADIRHANGSQLSLFDNVYEEQKALHKRKKKSCKGSNKYLSNFKCKSKSLQLCSGKTTGKGFSEKLEIRSLPDCRDINSPRTASKRSWVSNASNEHGKTASQQSSLPTSGSMLPPTPLSSSTHIKHTKMSKLASELSEKDDSCSKDSIKHVCESIDAVFKNYVKQESNSKCPESNLSNKMEESTSKCSKRWIGHKISSFGAGRRDNTEVSTRFSNILKTSNEKFISGNLGIMTGACSKYQILSGSGSTIPASMRKPDINKYASSIACCSPIENIFAVNSASSSIQQKEISENEPYVCGDCRVNNIPICTHKPKDGKKRRDEIKRIRLSSIYPVEITRDKRRREYKKCDKGTRCKLGCGKKTLPPTEVLKTCFQISPSMEEKSVQKNDVCDESEQTCSIQQVDVNLQCNSSLSVQTGNEPEGCMCEELSNQSFPSKGDEETDSCACSTPASVTNEEPGGVSSGSKSSHHSTDIPDKPAATPSCCAHAVQSTHPGEGGQESKTPTSSKCDIPEKSVCSRENIAVENQALVNEANENQTKTCPCNTSGEGQLQTNVSEDKSTVSGTGSDAKEKEKQETECSCVPETSTKNETNENTCVTKQPCNCDESPNLCVDTEVEVCSCSAEGSTRNAPQCSQSENVGAGEGNCSQLIAYVLDCNECHAPVTAGKPPDKLQGCTTDDKITRKDPQAICSPNVSQSPACSTIVNQINALSNSCYSCSNEASRIVPMTTTCHDHGFNFSQVLPCTHYATSSEHFNNHSVVGQITGTMSPDGTILIDYDSLCEILAMQPEVQKWAAQYRNEDQNTCRGNSILPTIPETASFSCSNGPTSNSCGICYPQQPAGGQQPMRTLGEVSGCNCWLKVDIAPPPSCGASFFKPPEGSKPTGTYVTADPSRQSVVCPHTQRDSAVRLCNSAHVRTPAPVQSPQSVCEAPTAGVTACESIPPTPPVLVQTAPAQAPYSSVCQGPQTATSYQATPPTLPSCSKSSSATAPCSTQGTPSASCKAPDNCSCSLVCSCQPEIRIIRDNASPGVASALDWSLGKHTRVESWETESRSHYKPFPVSRTLPIIPVESWETESRCRCKQFPASRIPTIVPGPRNPQNERGTLGLDSFARINAFQNAHMAVGATEAAKAACGQANLGTPSFVSQRTLYRTTLPSQQQFSDPYRPTCQSEALFSNQPCSRKALFRPAPSAQSSEQPRCLNRTLSGSCASLNPDYVAVYREFKYPRNIDCLTPQPFCGPPSATRACRVTSTFRAGDACEPHPRYRPLHPEGRRSASQPFITGNPGSSFNSRINKSKMSSAGSARHSAISRRGEGYKSIFAPREITNERPMNHLSSGGDAQSSDHLAVPFNNTTKTRRMGNERPTRESTNFFDNT